MTSTPISHPTTPAPQPAPGTEPRRAFHRAWLVPAIATVAAAAAVWHFGISPRIHAAEEARKEVAAPDARTVIAQPPVPQPAETELLLPGTVQAFRQTTLYAQTAGYLKTWLVDIGDSVKEGQVLAEIDTPQVDQQLAQSKAVLEQTDANLKLANITAKRWQELLKSHATAAQDADEKVSAAAVAVANYAAAKANVEQLTELQRYKRIVAPFDGVITARAVEVGALISVGSTPTELFRIAQTNRMRVLVNVPQAYMRSIIAGMQATLIAREYGSRTFDGTVTRTSKAIDPQSRTLLTEVAMPNQDGAMLPGMYAQIRFQLKSLTPTVLIPASALVIRSSGPMVAVVDASHRYAYKKVRLGRDLGAQIEIADGLDAHDLVVTTPSDDLTEGMALNVQEPKKTAAH